MLSVSDPYGVIDFADAREAYAYYIDGDPFGKVIIRVA